MCRAYKDIFIYVLCVQGYIHLCVVRTRIYSFEYMSRIYMGAEGAGSCLTYSFTSRVYSVAGGAATPVLESVVAVDGMLQVNPRP